MKGYSMAEIMYDPSNCGKEFRNSRGRKVKVRKYHMTDKEKVKFRKRWEEDVKDVSREIRAKAGTNFFNPYRKGIYYYQVQSLFLLGSNVWHSLPSIIKKLSQLMSSQEVIKNNKKMTLWELFKNRSYKSESVKSKDYIGKIQENFVFFQRLSHNHPYGYKLRQVNSAVDIKRSNMEGFSNGLYSYRLSTYKDKRRAFPIRDYREFDFPKQEHKYINYKFIGKIITRDKVIDRGKLL